MLNKFFKRRAARNIAKPWHVPSGERLYAIGDIHGRLDLFKALASAIEADIAARDATAEMRSIVVLLGDLIDRGPDSAGVVALAREWSVDRRIEILMGNHEEMFLEAFESTEVLKRFLKFGGLETLLSYGVDPATLAGEDMQAIQAEMNARIPATEREWIAGFDKLVERGDYLFVHAGILPGVPIAMQTGSNCRWIREPFLSHTAAHPSFVVHGHTVTEEVDLRSNRIGIDTGAFQSGRLTAIGLQRASRWLIEAYETPGGTVATKVSGLTPCATVPKAPDALTAE